MSTAQPIFTFLLATSTGEAMHTDVPVLSEDTTIAAGLSTMARACMTSDKATEQGVQQRSRSPGDRRARFLDVPIASADDKQLFQGFCSAATLFKMTTDRMLELANEDAKAAALVTAADLEKDEVFMATTLQHALSRNDSKSNAINERMSLVTALDNMNAKRARRMAATDSTGRVQGVLDGASVMTSLATTPDSTLAALLKAPVSELRPSKISWLSTCQASTRVIDVIRVLARKHIEGVAIVDERRRLIGEFRMSDLSLVDFDSGDLSLLFTDVATFKQHFGSPLGVDEADIPPFFTPDAYVNVKDVWDTMVVENRDRVYIVSNLQDAVPINVYSRADVLAYVFRVAKSPDSSHRA